MNDDDSDEWRLPWTRSTDRVINVVSWSLIIFTLTYLLWHIWRYLS